jgi:hypothetical protein
MGLPLGSCGHAQRREEKFARELGQRPLEFFLERPSQVHEAFTGVLHARARLERERQFFRRVLPPPVRKAGLVAEDVAAGELQMPRIAGDVRIDPVLCERLIEVPLPGADQAGTPCRSSSSRRAATGSSLPPR